MSGDNNIGPESSERRTRSTHLRILLVSGALPIAIVLAATLLMISWLPDLPDPIAVHWSGAGPDGFGAALPFIFTPLIIVLIFSVFAVAMSWRTTPSGRLSSGQKILLTINVWLSVVLSVGLGASVALQRGLTEAKDAPDVGIPLAIGAALGLVLAAGAWFILPRSEDFPQVGNSPKRIELHGDERLSWSHSTRFGNVPLIVMCLSLAFVVGILVFAFVTSPPIPVFAVVVLIITTLLVLTTVWWRVSTDRRGFIARGLMGWPVKRIPLEDIRTVQVIEVQPMRDFGGYGWRWTGGGRSGVILRTGPGIEITSSSGKRFVVTVDDAETGAGVIAALLKKQTSRAE